MTRLQEVLQGKGANYIFPFFWQHGEREEVLREYMNAIRSCNIGAVCLESRPHPDFCGPKWWQDLEVIIDEAKKLDMKVWILDDSHFPTGFANGAIETAPDELTHQYMVKRTMEMSGPVLGAEFELKEFMREAPLPPWMPPKPAPKRVFHDDELVAILACPIEGGDILGEPIDLTGRVCEDGIVRFDLPAGYFRIYVIYLTRKADGRNDYINFMDEASCKLLLDAVYEPHYEHFGDEFGKTILGFFSDEPPIGNTPGYMPAGPIGSPDQNLPWSGRAADALTQAFGSADWKTSIPLLWADGADSGKQAKIRSAYMNMVTRLVQECFSAQNGRWCAEHGVEYIGHMLEDCDMSSDLGISMGHYFRGLSGQHMAGIDNIGGQVMIAGADVTRHPNSACADEAGFYTYTLAKLGVSHAAIDPKKKGRCLCENMGAYGWQSGTKEQKFLMDHFMSRGVNRFVPHAFSPAPFPDPDCPPHFYAHGENPLYRAFGQLMAYSNRVCHLISDGHACPDVALLYNGESKWAGGADSNIPATRALTCGQVDFHFLPTDVFRPDDEYPCTFDGQILKVNRVSYGALLISGCDYVEKPAADFIIRAAETGYPVIWLNKRASGVSDGTAEDNAALQAAAEKQVCVPTEAAAEAVKAVLTPQVSIAPASRRITSYHYVSDAEYYLLLNEDPQDLYSGTITLNAEGTCSVYDPWANRLYPVGTAAGRIEIPAVLEPLQLLILVVEKDKAEYTSGSLWKDQLREYQILKKMETEKPGTEITSFEVRRLAAPDYLFRKEPALAEAEVRTVTAPYTGMQIADPQFSGYYIYETAITREQIEAEKSETAEKTQKDLWMTIDQVGEAAEVFWNGRSLGMLLQAPYNYLIPGELVEKENRLKIEAATLAERKVKAMGLNIASMSVTRPLSANGIVGKVTVYEIQEVIMEYTVNHLSEHITQILDPTEVSAFLVEGSDRAVLIDTGIGIEGLKETVEKITDKPYTVLLTHGHGDHAGGCAGFPEVYMDQADLALVREHGMEMRIGYCQMTFGMKEQFTGIHTDFCPERDMVPEPEEGKEFKPLTDGMKFELGGVSVEVISVPGHTRGSCMMLIPEERTILFGDCCNINTLVGGKESTTISEYLTSLERMKTMEDRYDTVLYSHGPAIGPACALDDNIELCRRILAGTDDHVPAEGIGGPGFLAAARAGGIERADGRYGNIFYTEMTAK